MNCSGWKLGLRAELKKAVSGSSGLSSLKLNQIDTLNLSGNLPLGGLPKNFVALLKYQKRF